MIASLKWHIARFRGTEDGSMVVPFALWMPVFLMVILSAAELGALTMRQAAMERSLDVTVRDLKLNLNGVSDHESLKKSICDGAPVLPGCDKLLKLEMIRLDLRNWTTPPLDADCIDTAEPVNPQRTFQIGRGNEMMLLRACYKYRPITPAGMLSSSLPKDGEGYTAIVAATAFVHEP